MLSFYFEKYWINLWRISTNVKILVILFTTNSCLFTLTHVTPPGCQTIQRCNSLMLLQCKIAAILTGHAWINGENELWSSSRQSFVSKLSQVTQEALSTHPLGNWSVQIRYSESNWHMCEWMTRKNDDLFIVFRKRR